MEKILCIDMDGVLAEYKWSGVGLERLQGHFLSLAPCRNICDSIRIILSDLFLSSLLDVYVVSSLMPGAPFCRKEKEKWLSRELPELADDHRLFPAPGTSKADIVEHTIGMPLHRDVFLLDDFTSNLYSWQLRGGTGIKVLNGINGKNGTWKGSKISICRKETAEMITSSIMKAVYHEPYSRTAV